MNNPKSFNDAYTDTMSRLEAIIASRRAQLALEESIFDGPASLSDAFGVAFHVALGLMAMSVYALTLLALAGKI